MEFNISKSDLLDAITIVSKGMASRSTLPILSGILIDAQVGGEVVFQSTDLEISIRHIVRADVVQEGRAVIPGKLFGDIVKTLPDAAVSVEGNDTQAHIYCQGSFFTLATLNAADFPYFPEVTADTTIELDTQQLERAVRKVGRAVSKDESRVILTGILLEVEEGVIRLAATDSYRLAVAEMNLDTSVDMEDFKAVIPGKTFEDVSRLASSAQTVSIGFADNQVVFEFGETTFVSRKIEGTYPNYKQLVPPSHDVTVQLATADFATAIKRVALLAQTHTPIRLSFSAQDQQATITAKTQDVGNATEVIDAAVEGGDIDIAFNHQYILDGVSAIEGDTVIELQTPLKPGIVKSSTDDGFLYLAMPVRLS